MAPEALGFLAFGWGIVFLLLIFVAYKWTSARKRRKESG